MNRVFELASDCLHSASVEHKVALAQRASALMEKGQIDYTSDAYPLAISATVFPPRPELVEPGKLPRRGLASESGRIALLHALAHIEFYAIHLAWDILYRFRGLPVEFCQDWLGVAAEEALHFSMLRGRRCGAIPSIGDNGIRYTAPQSAGTPRRCDRLSGSRSFRRLHKPGRPEFRRYLAG